MLAIPEVERKAEVASEIGHQHVQPSMVSLPDMLAPNPLNLRVVFRIKDSHVIPYSYLLTHERLHI